jgi:hypothetical protein
VSTDAALEAPPGLTTAASSAGPPDARCRRARRRCSVRLRGRPSA